MTDAELAILSLVAEGPQHGYQIQQAIEARGMRDWTAIGFSSVYYILNKLEREGLLTSHLTPSERGPARKVYRLTRAGHGVLQTAIADLLSTPHDHGNSFSLGLANLHLLRPEQVRGALDVYEGRLRARIADLSHRREAQSAVQPDRPLQVAAIFDYSLRLLLAELEWLVEFRQAWEAQHPSTAEGAAAAHHTPDSTPTPPPHRTEPLPRPATGRADQEGVADDGPGEA